VLVVGLGYVVGRTVVAIIPIVTGLVLAAAAIAALVAARRVKNPLGAAVVLGAFMVIDLAWNNAPNESTGLPPSVYEDLRPDTRNETVALLKERVVVTADRRDRVELTGIAYHWPNIGLVHGFEHVFGHNPLRLKWFYEATRAPDTVASAEQRAFSPLFPSYRSAFADLLGLRFILTGVPVEQIDTSLQPGDLTFIARTAEAYVYENPRALPRVM